MTNSIIDIKFCLLEIAMQETFTPGKNYKIEIAKLGKFTMAEFTKTP